MKIAILYDSDDQESAKLFSLLSSSISKQGTQLEVIDAVAKKLKSCVGCFGCWVKTPGICIYSTDGGQEYLNQIYDADHLIIISRIIWGSYSTTIKKYCDRMLPLLHPYFRKLNGEMHHRLRYGKYPRLIVIGFGACTTAEEDTFKKYTESHRNNTGSINVNGTFIINAENKLEACKEWLLKEISK